VGKWRESYKTTGSPLKLFLSAHVIAAHELWRAADRTAV